MTKFLTAAAWSALVLGGAAVADTPPAETEVVTEEVMTEAPTDITTTYSEVEAVEAEDETVEGEDTAEAEGEDETSFDASEETEVDETDETETE